MDREADFGGAADLEEGDEDLQDEGEGEPEPALTQAERDKRKERLCERMKVAVIRVVEKEVEARTDFQVAVNPVVVSALADLTSKFAESLARDLEAFAHHAGRKTVTSDDVLLAARRNPDVKSALAGFAKELAKSSDQQQPRKRKRPLSKTLPGD